MFGHGTKIAAAEIPRDQAQAPPGVPLSTLVVRFTNNVVFSADSW